MGGWSDKTKLILISTLVEVVVEVEVELGNILGVPKLIYMARAYSTVVVLVFFNKKNDYLGACFHQKKKEKCCQTVDGFQKYF